MDIKRILEIQSQRGATSISLDKQMKPVEWVVNDCRRYIQDRSEVYRDLDPVAKRNSIKELIVGYVMQNNFLVENYVTDDGHSDTNRLVDRLVEDITDYGILTSAMMNPDVFEIRCNGKEIKVEINGRMEDLMDNEGNIVSFSSIEQQDIVMRKLMGDARLTPKDSLQNSRTVEGYRIAAVHSSRISPDPSDPTAQQYHGFVLRKFKKTKMGLDQIVRNKTLSDNMARFLSLVTAGGLTFCTVGPTASGKTTTNNAILQAVPPTTRTVLIQNPSEIDLRMKDSSGRVYNDVLHLEAIDKENPTNRDATMQNLMIHSLRLSPTFMSFGELRDNKEFKLGLQIGQAGHPFNCTYHAWDAYDAIMRFLVAYLSESGNEPSHLALTTITGIIDVIVVQKKLRDNTRKIIQISEVLGVSDENKETPKINDLYIFDIDQDPIYDEAGNIVEIRGRHKRVGKLQGRAVKKLRLEGVKPSDYDFIVRDVFDEQETYTGAGLFK